MVSEGSNCAMTTTGGSVGDGGGETVPGTSVIGVVAVEDAMVCRCVRFVLVCVCVCVRVVDKIRFWFGFCCRFVACRLSYTNCALRT